MWDGGWGICARGEGSRGGENGGGAEEYGCGVKKV